MAYGSGTGVVLDYDRADLLLGKAEEQGIEDAGVQQIILAEDRNAREMRKQKMFAEDIAAGKFMNDDYSVNTDGYIWY